MAVRARSPASGVTVRRISLRGMRVWVHRGQAVLLLVVGILLGAAATGATVGREGPPRPLSARIAGVLTPPRAHLPARIQIGTQPQPGPADGAAATVPQAPYEPPGQEAGGRDAAKQDRAGSAPAPVVTVQPIPATVVPPTVYTYPPDDHGGSSGRSGSDGGTGDGGHR